MHWSRFALRRKSFLKSVDMADSDIINSSDYALITTRVSEESSLWKNNY